MWHEFSRQRRSMLARFTGELQETSWIPAADVYRTREGWLLKLELAGVCQDEVAIHVSGNRVRVVGTRRDWLLDECRECQSLEISYCRFERHFELPASLEQARIVTDYRDGMLFVRIILEANSS